MSDPQNVPETKPGRTDIDDLVDAAKAQPTPEGLEPLYRATFALPAWHFVGTGAFPNVRPFCGIVDDVGYVMAFTNPDRARFYAGQQGVLAFGDKPSILSFPVEEAIRHCIELHRIKARGVLFDDGWGNWHFPLQALPEYHRRYRPSED